VRLVVEVPAALPDGARALAQQLAGALDDAAYPKRQAFRDASREDQAAESASSERKDA